MNGHPPNRSGKGLRNASLNQQFIMTTSRNISWHKRKKETAGNNPAVSNFCVMDARLLRSEEHTSELQSLMRISYAVFCLKKKNNNKTTKEPTQLHTHIALTNSYYTQ